jgi:hypothetical protein
VAKKPTPQQLKEVEEKEIKRESWSQQKQHKKVHNVTMLLIIRGF